MKRAFVAALVVGFAASCGIAASPSGVVQRVQYAGPYAMPDVSYTACNGAVGSLDKALEPVSVVAFVASGCPTCAVDQRLIDLTHRFGGLPISVVQVSDNGPGCVSPCNLGNTQMMTMCDSKGQLRRSLGQPPNGTVLLLDSNKCVIGAGTLNNLPDIEYRATQQAHRVENNFYNLDRIDIYIN